MSDVELKRECEDARLSVRTKHCLLNEANKRAAEGLPRLSLAGFRELPDDELLGIPNLGRASLRELKTGAPSMGNADAYPDAVERKAKVRGMREAGVSFADIASALGVSVSRARQLHEGAVRRRIPASEAGSDAQ